MSYTYICHSINCICFMLIISIIRQKFQHYTNKINDNNVINNNSVHEPGTCLGYRDYFCLESCVCVCVCVCVLSPPPSALTTIHMKGICNN